MSLDALATNLAEMDLSSTTTTSTAIPLVMAPILDTPIVQEIFAHDLDIYSLEKETDMRRCILEVPNIYSDRYFDDEDFIYARLGFPPEMQEYHNLDYMAYMEANNLVINSNELDMNPCSVMGKVLYIYQHISAYYTSLRHLRPIERMSYLPADLIAWVYNITDTVRVLLDNGVLRIPKDRQQQPLEMLEEMIYGLGLITCHARLICNHYKHQQGHARGEVGLCDMGELHMKKIIRLANNMCVILLCFWMYL